MRWFVEISSLGQGSGLSSTLCVEAPQWQPALQRARELRGDNGQLSNFSIELLDDGFRAIDPASRLRYVVRRAPDDAPLTQGDGAPKSSDNGKSDGKPDSKKGKDKGKDNKPASSRGKVDGTSKPAKTLQYSPEKAAAVREAMGEAKPKISIPHDRVPPPPGGAPRAIAKTTESAQSTPEPTASDTLDDGLPGFEVIRTHERAATAESPIHYREAAYAVPPSTTDGAIDRLLRDRLDVLRTEMASLRGGKLVNLAAFDHAYEKKPARPPIVTLTWKDWRGDTPELSFKRGNGAPVEQPRPPMASIPAAPPAPSAPPPPPPAPVAVEVPKPAQTPSGATAPLDGAPAPQHGAPAPQAGAPAPQPVAPAPQPVAAPEPPPVAEEPERISVEVEEAPAMVPGRVIDVEAAAAPPPPPAPAPAPVVAAPPPAVVAAPPAPVVAAPPPAPVVAAPPPAPVVAAPAPPPPAIAEPAPAPVTAKIVTPAVATTGGSSAPPPSKKPMSVPAPSQVPTTRLAPPPPAPTKTKRIAGDDLIVELFEACSELHFMSDALHAAEFVLALTMDKMPSEVGLVSMFDINRREFVVVRQVGGKNSALCHRIPERAPLVANAMRSQRAVVIADARSDHRAVDERWTIIGVSPMTLVAAPVAVGGRYLGLLELANPLDGAAFTDGDGHALTYIGQQLGEYLAAQGVIVDQESILANQPDPTPKKAAPEQRASSSGKRR